MYIYILCVVCPYIYYSYIYLYIYIYLLGSNGATQLIVALWGRLSQRDVLICSPVWANTGLNPSPGNGVHAWD